MTCEDCPRTAHVMHNDRPYCVTHWRARTRPQLIPKHP